MADGYLLPANATPFERAGEMMLQSISRLPVEVVRQSHDPMTCPVALLPWLAAHRGVDEWDDAWPEAVQRQVVALSYQTLAHRGTRGAMVAMLRAMGLASVSYQNAWEYGGAPYCFRLDLGIDAVTVFGLADAELLERVIVRTKAARSFCDGLTISRPLGPGQKGLVGVLTLVTIMSLFEPPPGPLAPAQAVRGLSGALIFVSALTMATPSPPFGAPQGTLQLGGALIMISTMLLTG